MKLLTRRLWLACGVALLIVTSACRAQTVYSANNDFSLTNGNPNGVWGYGHSTSLCSTYSPNPFGVSVPFYQLDLWSADIDGTLTPHVSKNYMNATTYPATTMLAPFQMVMHPGPNREYSLLRFTAPDAGRYDFSASFVGVDWIGTTTDVHVLKNGSVIWSSAINGFMSTTATIGSAQLASGETLDVAVGVGSNGHYFFDTTGVEFDVTHICPINFDGFLEPIGGADATGGSFSTPILSRKLGSTIPVKFKGTACAGSPVLAGIHTLQAIKYTSATASDSPINATSSDSATIGSQFRLTGNQWHFNLDTGYLSKGTWMLVATLSDGSTHFVWVTLK